MSQQAEIRSDVPELPPALLRGVVEAALREDLGWGDVTSDSLLPAELTAEATMVARGDGVVAGLPVARAAFHAMDPNLHVELLARDGETVGAGRSLLRVAGRARAILSAERIALNFVQRMSGIATLTARYVAAVAGTDARIVDTRKTTPGLRLLEKYAVRCGGGHNHRFHLGDALLLKDNHRAALAAAGVGLVEAVHRARAALPHTVTIEIELDTLDQLDETLAAEPDTILLDNMPPEVLAEAVRRIGGRARTEASGGITLETVRRTAEAGVGLISVGALTHSAPAFDVALDFNV
ncbi:MAG TPA: carboxylating nicotinate-nucleotide diphosphorylase [Longimicrobiales bacterium]|nr:carboxylating nicotinate-nucleotide diphosphorylase [Longimicrobiales bacterium]